MKRNQDGFILLEGLYEDHYVPLSKFDPHRYGAMLKQYWEKRAELSADDEKIRDFVNITYVDNEYTPSTEEQTRAILESSGKRVDKLRMSILP